MGLSVEQCRAGRALLSWSMGDLAAAAGVGIMTLNRFENGQTIRPASIDKIIAAFTAAGITFIAAGVSSPDGGEGVRRDQPPRTDL